MPVCEKVSGGEVYLRGIDRTVTVGDRVDVNEAFADYLLEERTDFEPVDVQDAEFRQVDDGDGDAPQAEDGPPDEEAAPLDPSDHSVADLEDELQDIDDVAALNAIRKAEKNADDPRSTALDAIDSRIADVEE